MSELYPAPPAVCQRCRYNKLNYLGLLPRHQFPNSCDFLEDCTDSALIPESVHIALSLLAVSTAQRGHCPLKQYADYLE